MIKKYRKKPIIIEAIKLEKDNLSETAQWCKGYISLESGFYKLSIPTLEGTMDCHLGDYVLKGMVGEFYPCKKEIFEASYELLSGNSSL
jgi:hypothetical protein